VTTADPDGDLSIEIIDASQVSRYQFGHKSADFLICGGCGTFAAAVTKTKNGTRGILNVRVLDEIALNSKKVTHVYFEKETPEQRLLRRLQTWSPARFNRLTGV
jgi:hypothetical protein